MKIKNLVMIPLLVLIATTKINKKKKGRNTKVNTVETKKC